MARSYVSAVIAAPVESVWSCVRDFSKVPYFSEVVECSIVGGGPGDQVGAVRDFRLKSGFAGQEQLIGLSDLHHRAAYSLIAGEGLKFSHYVAELQLLPVTLGWPQTFLQWWSTYEVAAEDHAEVSHWIEESVYARCIEGIRQLVER